MKKESTVEFGRHFRCWHCSSTLLQWGNIGEIRENNAWMKERDYNAVCMECGKATTHTKCWWSDVEPDFKKVTIHERKP